MKILMLSWRDMKHPNKGGAEIVTDIYLEGLSKLGHEVTLFSAEYPGCKNNEEFNGYHIVRKGGQLGVHWHGLLYAKKNEKEFDIIIDQVNTIPFFTPLFIKRGKTIAHFNQLCKNIWFYEKSLPISLIGYLAESVYLKFYKNAGIITISESTKQDLIKYAWAKPENIFVSEMQIDFPALEKPAKKENQFVFCGRLTASKRPEDCIKALAQIENKETKLYIIGEGREDYKNKLKKLVNSLNLENRVIFTGRISKEERNNIMAKSISILVTSVREGWGLIVTEANANGTIAITYNVPGLIDANKTGLTTKIKENNPGALALLMDKVIKDKKLMQAMSNASIKYAKTGIIGPSRQADWRCG